MQLVTFFRSKIFLQRNVVYNNRNFIPFYNVGTESEGHGRPDYGTENQTYIIDGSGEKFSLRFYKSN